MSDTNGERREISEKIRQPFRRGRIAILLLLLCQCETIFDLYTFNQGKLVRQALPDEYTARSCMEHLCHSLVLYHYPWVSREEAENPDIKACQDRKMKEMTETAALCWTQAQYEDDISQTSCPEVMEFPAMVALINFITGKRECVP